MCKERFRTGARAEYYNVSWEGNKNGTRILYYTFEWARVQHSVGIYGVCSAAWNACFFRVTVYNNNNNNNNNLILYCIYRKCYTTATAVSDINRGPRET